MSGPIPKLHLPFADWPEIDRRMWDTAVENDDPFADGPGGWLAESTLHKYWMGWRRFLGFLTMTDADALKEKPFDRLTRARVHEFVEHLGLVGPRILRRSGCRALWVSPKGGPL